MKIIPASAESLPVIQDLAYQTWPVAFGNILSKEQISYMLEKMYAPDVLYDNLQNGHCFLLACDENDHALGFASCQLDYEPGKCQLHKLYVLPEQQGRGAGIALMNAVKAMAISHKQTALLLAVNRYNPAACFYEQYGFRIIREEDIAIGNDFYRNDFIMEFLIHSLS